MTAITKAWTNIADSAVDPDSPLTTSLITALRDNAIHVREWLGASYTAGAVQDHSHDGVDSALIELGANLVRNASWESGEAAWAFTDYTGGSHAVSPSAHQHGAKSITFTSTSTANGGGEAICNAYLPCAATDEYSWKFWVWASTANVSSKVQLIWYDNAQSQISTTDIYTSTNTPTSAALERGLTTAPSGARFVRVRLIGGVPASGSATGTIRFDGLAVGDQLPLDGTYLVNASVAQGHLKSTFGDVGTTAVTPVVVTLAGGNYGFYPQGYIGSGSQTVTIFGQIAAFNQTSPISQIILGTSSGSVTAYARQYYVQASPPYDLGNGEIPVFAFAALDSGGRVLHSYVAEDPPWANNGPTDIRADYYRGGKAYARRRTIALPPAALRGTPAERIAYLAALEAAPWVDYEITQEIKQADMALLPHPFLQCMQDVAAVVLLDPVGRMAEQLHRLHLQGETIARLLAEDYLQIDNTPLTAQTPPGVQPVRVRWKAT